MKKILSSLLIMVLLQSASIAQDFSLSNPTMTPAPGIYPGGTETVSFNFAVSQNYTFSSNPASNNYAYITFSFTKLNPTSAGPSGTGATLFNWTLTTNGGTGVGLVYTWTGTTKTVTMLNVPNSYSILFTNVPITAPATQAETDIRVAGQFTDPGNAPTGLTSNNNAVIATYTVTGAPTPVLLLFFNGTKHDNSVDLKWQTSSEINSNYFEVEFSSNGIQWAGIGKVNAAGNSTVPQNYSLVHHSPVNGTNFYRLKMVDKDGKVKLSNVITVNFTIVGISINSVNPNPFNDKIKIEISSDKNAKIYIQLSDNSGRIIKTLNVVLQNGINQVWMNDLGSLSKGIYTLEIKTAYTNFRVKIKK